MSREEKSVNGAIQGGSLLVTQSVCVVPLGTLEEQFALTCVMAEPTSFNHTFIGLDEETIGLVTDVLEECSYVRLKDQVIRRLSVSEKAKLNHLLN
ncbi:unnamed protein product [Hermetia illucens]|uniref:DUF7041 domain-containing protein n=1 Tax=Hermetia illucens TaxID=343691 RepID=A0A7R8Z393_HERIL|nr:unnamed protein product [Hermetia illucens]